MTAQEFAALAEELGHRAFVALAMENASWVKEVDLDEHAPA